MLRGATRMALSCLTLLGAMLPVACVYEQIPEAYDEADTYIHLNLISSNIKYIDNQLVTVIKIQMICKCKYKTI